MNRMQVRAAHDSRLGVRTVRRNPTPPNRAAMPSLALPALAAVAAGSALGGVLRYGVALLVPTPGGIPIATLLINVTGSMLLGAFASAAAGGAPDAPWRLFLTVGLCGGFTTFSAFGLETFRLMQAGAGGRAALYVAASVLLSLAGAAGGVAVGSRLAGAAAGGAG